MFNSIPIILNLLTNRNIALIYSVTICEQKTENCARPESFQHKLQHKGLPAWIKDTQKEKGETDFFPRAALLQCRRLQFPHHEPLWKD